MTFNPEQSDRFASFAHPEVLVSTEWVEANLEAEGLVLIECDEDILLFETGHIPGAAKLDWHTELNHPVTRDYLDGQDMASLLSSKGISRDDFIVIYGDKSN